MRLSKILQQSLHREGHLGLLKRAPGGEAKHISLFAQRFKGSTYRRYRQKGLLKVDTTRLACLCRRMTIIPRIEFVAEIPLLKDVLAERPERAVAREDAFNRVTQHVAGISIKAVDEVESDVTLKGGLLKDRF